MEDYKEEIKHLILEYYENFGDESLINFKSTSEILTMVRGVIPSEPISEHDIYEVMKEIGFTQELKSITEKVCVFEGNKEKGIPPEYDEVEIESLFLWKMFKK